MILKCLGSSSSGNCYLLTSKEGQTLAVEAGVDFSEVKKGVDYRPSTIVGCVVSHEHRDHCKCLPDFLRNGIRVLASEGVIGSFGDLGASSTFTKKIEPMHGYQIGAFRVFTLPVCHDVPCLGFLISHEEMGKLLFVTDTMMIEYRIQGLNHLMVEANYSDEILRRNIEEGLMPASMKDRLMRTHMEVGTTCELLRANDLGAAQEVVLLHLSARNSDADEFKAMAERASGVPCYVAKKGLILDITRI